jgi:hypothetical protein
MNWKAVCHPKQQRSLGIMNLNYMSTALRVRWAWNLRAEVQKTFCSLVSPLEEQGRNIFNAAATMVVGNGRRCYLLD